MHTPAQGAGIVLASGSAPGAASLGVERVQAKLTDCMSTVFELGAAESALFPRSANAHYVVPGACVSEIQFTPDTKTMLRMISEHPFGPPELCYYTAVTDVPGLASPLRQGQGYLYSLVGPAASTTMRAMTIPCILCRMSCMNSVPCRS